MKSLVVKRSIVLSGHKTSVSLEDAFWRGLKDIAASRRMTLSDLVCSIDLKRERGNLSVGPTAIRAQSLSGARSVRPRSAPPLNTLPTLRSGFPLSSFAAALRKLCWQSHLNRPRGDAAFIGPAWRRPTPCPLSQKPKLRRKLQKP